MSDKSAVLEFDFRLTDSEYSTIHHALLTLSREQAVPEYRQMYLDLITKLDRQSFNRLRAWERATHPSDDGAGGRNGVGRR